jgi:hypothetical protein
VSAAPPFFVGWARGLDARLRRVLLPIGIGALLGLPLLGVLLGALAGDTAPRGFGTVPGEPVWAELPRAEALRGVVLDGPTPLLYLPPAPGHPEGRTLLLSGDGKTGAGFDAVALAGREVAAEGFVLRRGTIEMLVLAAPPMPTGAAAETPAPIALGRWRITGEICDGKCAAGGMRPGTGIAHRACATLCLDGDIPAVFVASRPVDGRAFLVLATADGRPALPAFRDLIGQRVTLEGQVSRLGGVLLFRAEVP